MRITVVGGGVMGLCAAWACAADGHAVTVLEQGVIPNPKGSSVDEHRLIRRAYGVSHGYMRMAGLAYAAWERVWAALGESLYHATGTLLLDRGAAGWGADSLAALRADGVPMQALDAGALARRFPFLDADGVRGAHLVADGGALLAGRIVERLAAHLGGHGISLRAQARVVEIWPGAARVTLDDGGIVEADALVVAAGPWSARLLPSLRARLTPSRQVVAYVRPPDAHAAAWREAPAVIDIGDGGSGLYVVPPVAGTGLKVGDHGFSRTGDPDDDRSVAAAEAEALLARFRPLLADAGAYRVAEARACFYSVAEYERFIVEPVERAWVMAGFSGHGFKFAPLLGEAVADAIAGRRAAADVTAWAAGRE